MADKFEVFAREKTSLTKPDAKYTLWCPFCDDWRLTDSIVARKKMGVHIADKHPDDVRFARGTKPPELDPIDELEPVEQLNMEDWEVSQ